MAEELSHVERHFIVADLGRGQPMQAVVIVARAPKPMDKDEQGRWIVPDAGDIKMRYVVTKARRFDAAAEYPDILQEIRLDQAICEGRFPPARTHTIINTTGGSAVVADAFHKEHVRVVGITVHGGEFSTAREGDQYHVSFDEIVGYVKDSASRNMLKFAADTVDEQTFSKQIEGFGQRRNRNTGKTEYEALVDQPESDLLMAVGLAVWFGEKTDAGKYYGPPTPSDIAPPYNPLTGKGR
jgi:hypothetical protein